MYIVNLLLYILLFVYDNCGLDTTIFDTEVRIQLLYVTSQTCILTYTIHYALLECSVSVHCK